jgi:hypothetical protein
VPGPPGQPEVDASIVAPSAGGGQIGDKDDDAAATVVAAAPAPRKRGGAQHSQTHAGRGRKRAVLTEQEPSFKGVDFSNASRSTSTSLGGYSAHFGGDVPHGAQSGWVSTLGGIPTTCAATDYTSLHQSHAASVPHVGSAQGYGAGWSAANIMNVMPRVSLPSSTAVVPGFGGLYPIVATAPSLNATAVNAAWMAGLAGSHSVAGWNSAQHSSLGGGAPIS